MPGMESLLGDSFLGFVIQQRMGHMKVTIPPMEIECFSKESIVRVKCGWSRPPWCRDEYCLVKLPNGYRYYELVSEVIFRDSQECYVKAKVAWDNGRHFVELRFCGYHGEGSLDGVPRQWVLKEGAV